MAPVILCLSTRWRWVASFTLQLPWKGGWVGRRAGMDVFKKRKSLCPVGIQTPGLPACSLVTMLSVPLIYNNYPFTWWRIIAFLRLQPQIQRKPIISCAKTRKKLVDMWMLHVCNMLFGSPRSQIHDDISHMHFSFPLVHSVNKAPDSICFTYSVETVIWVCMQYVSSSWHSIIGHVCLWQAVLST
jgi:hypothetical protein